VFKDRRLFILGEIIHNPEVNEQIRSLGIKNLMGKNKEADIADLQPNDVVIVPAFGTEVSTLQQIKERGCQIVDTTFGDVMNGGNKQEFLEKFRNAYSPGFDPDVHLRTIGVANQTTMLRGETEEVQRRIRQAIVDRDGAEAATKNFRFFDTICGATQERQDALRELLDIKMDLLLVVGGYNSSNTSHLAEMGEETLPTYFVLN